MLAHQHSDRQALRRRKASLRDKADYFFSSTTKKRSEVTQFASELGTLGETVAIGGFLRDLLLDGNVRFTSDVDFVVNPESMAEFERVMGGLDAHRNRFGGYAVQLSKWKVEVWPLKTTWAAVHQHVAVNDIRDLLKVTFFNWDAILYSVSDRRVLACDEYFENVGSRFLDINLRPNPNPLGNAIRAIRYSHRWGASVSRSLAEHIERQLVDNDWTEMVKYEKLSFPQPIMGFIDNHQMQAALCSFLQSQRSAHRLHTDPVQLTMPLTEA